MAIVNNAKTLKEKLPYGAMSEISKKLDTSRAYVSAVIEGKSHLRTEKAVRIKRMAEERAAQWAETLKN
jgi:plasmid maintenance system antidote protein VapI